MATHRVEARHLELTLLKFTLNVAWYAVFIDVIYSSAQLREMGSVISDKARENQKVRRPAPGTGCPLWEHHTALPLTSSLVDSKE